MASLLSIPSYRSKLPKSTSKKPLRLIAYEVDGAKYPVAANSYDLSAEQVAAYKLR
ncbi:MAG: hypothetical protein SWH54_15650 [Thermodesulfobacteriota bacterium]|nr:hypothetical protein [Thermodesulfobacteriota bacterium]